MYTNSMQCKAYDYKTWSFSLFLFGCLFNHFVSHKFCIDT